ncbi:hypothetical protein [Oceanisphaera sp.]|uniref:hypothetical protein n=1 Tax=Oceanisphaera sp. TaxID=1929979 RepID=UPI003A921E05
MIRRHDTGLNRGRRLVQQCPRLFATRPRRTRHPYDIAGLSHAGDHSTFLLLATGGVHQAKLADIVAIGDDEIAPLSAIYQAACLRSLKQNLLLEWADKTHVFISQHGKNCEHLVSK